MCISITQLAFAGAPDEGMGTVFWQIVESTQEMEFGCDETW
jgi:hypothetical protein